LLKNFAAYASENKAAKIGSLDRRKAVIYTGGLSQTAPEAQQSSADFTKIYQVLGKGVLFEIRIEAWTSEQLQYLDTFVSKIRLKF
jgi:hypothetical protein